MKETRCKPGDLAIIINDCNQPAHNGGMVRIEEEVTLPIVGAIWSCTALQPMTRIGDDVYPDDCRFLYEDDELLPIGNPPDDAIDETLFWKPVPPKGDSECAVEPVDEEAVTSA